MTRFDKIKNSETPKDLAECVAVAVVSVAKESETDVINFTLGEWIEKLTQWLNKSL